MLLGGDEIARTQRGNNNGWCQDNELSWFDWELDERGERLLEFTQRLIALRRAHPVFHRRDFLTGEDRAARGLPDAWWFRPDGRRMTQHDWSARRARGSGCSSTARGSPRRGRRASGSRTTRSCCCSTRSAEDARFNLPSRRFGAPWALVLDTADPGRRRRVALATRAGAPLDVTARSLVLLRRVD